MHTSYGVRIFVLSNFKRSRNAYFAKMNNYTITIK